VQNFVGIYSVCAAWIVTSVLFLVIRLLFRAPDIFVAIAQAAFLAAVFALAFPALPEHWSFVVFGASVFPLAKLNNHYKTRRKQKLRG
jgi:hypothetical protein